MAVGALTVLAFVLRLPHIDESIVLDEHYAFIETNVAWPWDVIERVRDGGENSPPLYFALAWAAMKLGDPDGPHPAPLPPARHGHGAGRLSPGVRTIGRRGGLIGRGSAGAQPVRHLLLERGPAVRDADVLVACSTLLLLLALETGRPTAGGSLYAVTVCAVLYAHYFGRVRADRAGRLGALDAARPLRELVWRTRRSWSATCRGCSSGWTRRATASPSSAPYGPPGAKEVGRELLRLFPGHPMFVPSDTAGPRRLSC